MINNTDLRIGNLFWDEDKTPCYFAGAWERKDGWIQRDSANNTYTDIQMYPIPLTTEILLKYGFKLYSEHNPNYHVREELLGVFEQDDFFGYWTNKEELRFGYFGKKKIQYLHQLQNLYYALTNSELNINL